MPKGVYDRQKRRAPAERAQISTRLDGDRLDFLEREAYILSARPPYVEVTVSDVIRRAIDKYRAETDTQPPPPKPPCQVARAGDSSWCAHCKLQWDTNDTDGPTCPHGGGKMT